MACRLIGTFAGARVARSATSGFAFRMSTGGSLIIKPSVTWADEHMIRGCGDRRRHTVEVGLVVGGRGFDGRLDPGELGERRMNERFGKGEGNLWNRNTIAKL